MCCALLEKRQYKQHDAEMWNLHIAGILNSEILIQYKLKISLNTYGRRRWGQSTAWKIQTIEQRRGRNGEEEGWWKNFCVSTRSRTRHPLYDNQWIWHYLKTPYWIQTSNQHPRFYVQASFHVTVLINYVRLNCRIKFYLKTNNAFISSLCVGSEVFCEILLQTGLACIIS